MHLLRTFIGEKIFWGPIGHMVSFKISSLSETSTFSIWEMLTSNPITFVKKFTRKNLFSKLCIQHLESLKMNNIFYLKFILFPSRIN